MSWITNRNNIKKLRKESKLTQQELTVKFNEHITSNEQRAKRITYATLSRWENNENQPDVDSFQILANIFDVDFLYIIGYQEREKSASSLIKQNLENLNFINISTESENKEIISILFNAFDTMSDELLWMNSKIDELNEEIKFLKDPSYDDGSGDL